MPKAGGLIRPGGDLELADQVVFAALVQQMRATIDATLGDPQTSPDYSYHLHRNPTHEEWCEPFFPRWVGFAHDSVAAIDEGAQFIVVADIAGFYEAIDLNTLRSDLNGLGVDAGVLQLLMDCLHRWPRVQRRGVPQGYSPSDILAKLYLNPVDLTLAAEGFSHRRWVDDYRIFCASEADARRALVLLADVLGNRGLVLQTAKSKILTSAAARAKFDEVHHLLAPIQDQVALAITPGDGDDSSDLPPWVLDQVLAEAEVAGAVAVLQEAFSQYFVAADRPQFNKSLFHYLLRRLAAAGDDTHLGEIIGLLRDHAEEFDDIADYSRAVGHSAELESEFLNLSAAGLMPYPYTVYQLLRWRVRGDDTLAPTLRTFVRRQALEPGVPWFVRAAARALLGKHGDAADLERLEAAYAGAQSDLERAELLCAVQRMEVGRRNALYGRAAGDGDLCSRAVRMARGGVISYEDC